MSKLKKNIDRTIGKLPTGYDVFKHSFGRISAPMAMNGERGSTHQFGNYVERHNWLRTGQFFKTLNTYVDYGVYALSSFNQGVMTTGASVVAGIVTENMVEAVGQKGINRLFSNCHTLFHKQKDSFENSQSLDKITEDLEDSDHNIRFN